VKEQRETVLSTPDTSLLPGSEACFRQLMDCMEEYAIYMLDREGQIVDLNRGARLNYLDLGQSGAVTAGQHFRVLFVAADAAAGVPEQQLAYAAQTGCYKGEGWRARRNGDRFWASFSLTAMHSSDGRLAGFAQVIKDAGERMHRGASPALEAALSEENERLHAATESGMDALCICEAARGATGEIEDFVYTFVNSNVEKLLNIPRNQMLGRRMCEVLPQRRECELFEEYKQVVLTGRTLVREISLQDERCSGMWLRIQAVKFKDGVVITTSDLTSWKKKESRLLHMARHDELTGLLNRTTLPERVLDAMERAASTGRRVALLMADLDSFKEINDTLGHAAGDRVLSTMADRVKGAVRATDSVIRLGGDEFVVVMPDIEGMQDVEACAERILDSLRRPIQVHSKTVVISCSIGTAVYPDTAHTVDDLLAQADANMYCVKGGSKNNLRSFHQNRSA